MARLIKVSSSPRQSMQSLVILCRYRTAMRCLNRSLLRQPCGLIRSCASPQPKYLMLFMVPVSLSLPFSGQVELNLTASSLSLSSRPISQAGFDYKNLTGEVASPALPVQRSVRSTIGLMRPDKGQSDNPSAVGERKSTPPGLDFSERPALPPSDSPYLVASRKCIQVELHFHLSEDTRRHMRSYEFLTRRMLISHLHSTQCFIPRSQWDHPGSAPSSTLNVQSIYFHVSLGDGT